MSKLFRYIFTNILFILTFSNIIYSQDTSYIKTELENLKKRVDSLEAIIKTTNLDSIKLNQISSVKDTVSVDSLKSDDLLSELTSFFSFNEQDQSSRRKRIDNLLNALRNQPGTITFRGDATSILQWKTGYNHFAVGSGSFDLFAFVNFGNNTNLFINLEAIGGNGPNPKINSFSSLNGDAGSLQDSSGRDLLHVLEAWSEFKFLGDWFKVTIGKIDLTNYFDINAGANDETMQFISGPFINSSAFPVPSNSPGLRSLIGIENFITFQVGLVSSDNSGDDLFSRLFKIIGTELNVNFGEGFAGNVNIFFYEDGIIKDATGYGLSFSGTVADQFKLFGRYNENNPNYEKGFPIRDYWMLGTEFNTTLLNQPIVVGSAFGVSNPYLTSLKEEYVGEAYLRFQFNDWVYLSPHLQYLKNAGGFSDEYLLVALRTQINF